MSDDYGSREIEALAARLPEGVRLRAEWDNTNQVLYGLRWQGAGGETHYRFARTRTECIWMLRDWLSRQGIPLPGEEL